MGDLSVRETENWIRRMSSRAFDSVQPTSRKIILHYVQERLRQKFGLRVIATQNAKGRGKCASLQYAISIFVHPFCGNVAKREREF